MLIILQVKISVNQEALKVTTPVTALLLLFKVKTAT
jgi:hypothetical protein